GRVVIEREDDGVETRLEVCVAPDDDVELRRLTLSNAGTAPRRLAVTSYAEVVLHHPAADAAHPAFSKLFVQTEWLPEPGALLARRRARGAGEATAWLVHALADAATAAFETDRVRFVGRGRTPADPQALDTGVALGGAGLTGTAGNVLDPVVSLRREVLLPPGAQVQMTFVLGAAADRAAAAELAARYADPTVVEPTFGRAASFAAHELARLDLSPRRARYYQHLAAALLYGDPGLRAPEDLLRRNT